MGLGLAWTNWSGGVGGFGLSYMVTRFYLISECRSGGGWWRDDGEIEGCDSDGYDEMVEGY